MPVPFRPVLPENTEIVEINLSAAIQAGGQTALSNRGQRGGAVGNANVTAPV